MTSPVADRLFTPTFFLSCGFNFIVFLSAFQLLPTAPIRIMDLGGSSAAAGWFVGLLTYGSAVSAPFTGALADRLGLRRTLVLCSLVILAASIGYAITARPATMLLLVAVHGCFWSGLLTSSGAYAMSLMPPSRRAEGIGYWGLSTVLAIAVAPSIGLWVYQRGWVWVCVSCALLNAAMAVLAAKLPPAPLAHRPAAEPAGHAPARWHDHVEWRVAIASVTLFLIAFGYGGVTSFAAIYARENGVSPPGLYFAVLAGVMLLTRPISGPLADRYGPSRVLVPCVLAATAGYLALAGGGTLTWLLTSAALVGVG
ncbi:MAG TPA: MFS transporter, partial [Vicinamibacterales bacterium]